MFEKHEMRKRRGSLFISIILIGLMLIMGIYSLYIHDWLWMFASFFSVLLFLIPVIIKRRWDINLPLSLRLAITIAIFLHLGGGVLGMYELVPRYDKFLHFFTSALIAFFAITIIYLLDKYTIKAFKMDLRGIIFVAIVTTMAIGVCWEIGEFIIDQLFGTHEQHGLYDTMTDLIYDTVAGIIVAIVGGICIKRGTFEGIIHSLNESVRMLAIKNKKDKALDDHHRGSK